MFNNLKYRLSHLNEDAWHRRMVNFAFGKSIKPSKACPYWWFIVPASPIVAGIKLLLILVFFVAVGLSLVVYIPIMQIWNHICLIGNWLFGRELKHSYWKYLTLNRDYYNFSYDDYRKNPTVKHPPIAYIAPTAAVLGVIYLASNNSEAVVWIGGVLFGLYILGLSYKRIAYPYLRRICPPIVWEHSRRDSSE